MRQKILIFGSLRRKLEPLFPFLEERDTEPVVFDSWIDLVKHIHDHECRVILLPVVMDKMNGIQCCQQIRQREAFRGVRVFIVADGDVGSARREAEAAGCDFFCAGDSVEEELKSEFLKFLWVDEIPGKRAASRFELSGPLFAIKDDKAILVELLNASQTGILFASPEPISMEASLVLRFQSSEGNELDIRAIVKRNIVLPVHYGDFRYGIGAQFLEMDEGSSQMLDWLLAYRERRIPTWSLSAVEKILTADAPRLAAMLREDTSRAFLDAFVKDLKPFERQALESDTYATQLIRDLTVTRVQCAVFFTFVPEARRNPGTTGETFVAPLQKLVERLKELEVRAEKRIAECLSRSFLEEHQNLISVADSLYKEKLKLLFAVEENFPIEGLNDSQRDFLKSVRDQVTTVRQTQRPEAPQTSQD